MESEAPSKVADSAKIVSHNEPGQTDQGSERKKLKATRRAKKKDKGKGKASTPVEVMTPQPEPIQDSGICPPNTPGVWCCNQSNCWRRNWSSHEFCYAAMSSAMLEDVVETLDTDSSKGEDGGDVVVTVVVVAPVTPPIRTTTDLGLEMTASMATQDVEVVVVAPIGATAAGAADGSQ